MACFSIYHPTLAGSDLLVDLDRSEIDMVCQAGHIATFKKAAFFFKQGEAATRVFVLLEGKAKITQLTTDGHQVFYRLLGPGDVFGVIAASHRGLYPVSSQAERHSAAISWDASTLIRLMEKFPKVGINAVKILSARVQELQERFRELATEKVERRIAHILVRLAAQTGKKDSIGVLIDFKLSKQDLAEMTGTTLFTVSRILKAWQEAKFVKVGREKIHILSPHSLVKISEDL